MAGTRMNKGGEQNRTASDSNEAKRPILQDESDALVDRIKEVVGDSSVSSFSRRCGFGESILRGYLAEGKRPGIDYLVSMANVGGVTVDWLATGRLPKYRRELTQSMSLGSMQSSNGALMAMEYSKGIDPAPANGAINGTLLELCLEACQQAHGADFAKALTTIQVRHAADLYNQLVVLANAKSPSTNLEDFCRLDAKALADQLRFFLQMGWALKFPPSDAPWS